MLRRFIVVMSVFAIWGCGMMVNPQEEDKELSAPQKVSMEMPKELQGKKREQKLEEERRSLGYLELKDDVAQAEEMIADLELNLLFVNQVIADIDSRCSSIELNRICTIEDGVLSFEIDENLSKKIDDPNYLIGDIIVFGKTEFVRYSDQSPYQYKIKLDNNFIDAISSTETIKWSKDEQRIYSWFEEESNKDKLDIEIDLNITTKGEKIMEIRDSYLDKLTKESDKFSLSIIKKVDEPRHYEVSSTSKMLQYIDEKENRNYFSSNGELSSSGGYLLFYGQFDGEEFREKEIFDGNGESVESYYCISDMDCDMEDEGSWGE